MPGASDKRWDKVFDAILKGKRIKSFMGLQDTGSAFDSKPFHSRGRLLTKEQMDSMTVE